MAKLNNGGNNSAGVYDAISDESFITTLREGITPAFVGPSSKGTVGEPIMFAGLEDFRSKFGEPNPALTAAHTCVERFLEYGSYGYFLRVANDAKYSCSLVSSENGFSVVGEMYQGLSSPDDSYSFNNDDVLMLYGRDQGAWNDYDWIMYPDTVDADKEAFYLEVYPKGSTSMLERHRCTLRDKLDGMRIQLNIEDKLEAQGSVLRAKVNRTNPRYVSNSSTRLINTVISGSMMFGDDGSEVTSDDIAEAWYEFEDDESYSVDSLIACGYSDPQVVVAMLEVEKARNDCHAVLDVPRDQQAYDKAVNYRRNVLNTDYAGASLYMPYTVHTASDGTEYECPASGEWARSAAYNENVAHRWFAVAGVTRGLVNADSLTEDLSKEARSVLTENQINYIQNVPGYGLAFMCQFTLQVDRSSLQDQNVMRLVRMLNSRIRQASLIALFDPGDRTSRLRLENIARSILNPVKRLRGLYGFDVICDSSNNTADTIATGDTILEVYIDPTIATRRIFLNMTVAPTGGVDAVVSLI